MTATVMPARLGSVGRALHGVIRGYRYLFSGRISSCRYLPTCSEYGLEAIERHGARRGSWLIVRRLSRCHPFGGHGIDPVPD